MTGSSRPRAERSIRTWIRGPLALAASGLLAGPPTLAPAQAPPGAPRPMTVDDLLAFRSATDPVVSPDGKWVAYVVATRDREANVNRSGIWLVAASGGTPRQLTRSPRTDRAPQWAPDGSWLAFLSDRGEKRVTQIHGIDPTGGEAWAVTKGETNVSSFRISPDGRHVAFIATAKSPAQDSVLERQRGRPIVRDSAYASDWAHLWVAPLEERVAGAVRRSSPDLLDVTSVEWSPDARALAWGAKPSPLLRRGPASAVYVQAEPGAPYRRVSDMPGGETVVSWTPELGLIIAGSAQTLGTYNRKLWRLPAECLTANAAAMCGTPTPLTAALDEDASFVSVSPRALLVEAAHRTGRGLYRIPLAGGRPTGPPVRITDDTRFYSSFSASRDGSTLAFLAERPVEAPDIHITSAARFSPTRLTTTNPQAAEFAYGEQRVVRWKSSADGEEIEGVLNLPIGHRSGARVPLLLVIHGGPSGVSAHRFPPTRGAYPIPVFNALGYAVLQPNYRGSTGYGERFRGLNRGDISGKDWIDVNSGVDAMIAAGIADSTRLGVMGWSFGGHHTYWGITQTARFKAASAGAGANDLISMYSQTDLPEFYHTYLGPRPWEDFRLYESRSAYRLVDRVRTPLLIQVGEADRRVPAEQSIQFYEAMSALGKAPVTLVLYPGQGHGITDPRLSRDLMQRNVEWFRKWIPAEARAVSEADK